MKLYGYPTFRSQKIAIALTELGVEHERIKVDLGAGEQRGEAFRALNPNGTVPVLEVDGLVLWESNAILTYLGEREGRLWPEDVIQRAEAHRWLYFCATELEPTAGPLWYEDVIAPRIGKEKDEALIAEKMKKMRRLSAVLESHLQSHDWFLGEEYSLVDSSYGPTLGAASMSRFPLGEYPALQAYMMLTKERESWGTIRKF